MIDTKNLIEVTGCVPSKKFKNDKDEEIQTYKIMRSVNGYPIDSEKTIKPFEKGFYYPRPYYKKVTLVNSKGEHYDAYITIARIGDKYEFVV